jgi:CBS domain-containing protein
MVASTGRAAATSRALEEEETMVGKSDAGRNDARKADARSGRGAKKGEARREDGRTAAAGAAVGGSDRLGRSGGGTASRASRTVRDCMSKEPRTCSPEDRLDRAAQIMWDGDCGCVPVVDEAGHLVGMITDRDTCMAAYSTGRRLRDIRVLEAMARNVFTVAPGDTVDRAASLMSEKQVRRLPVVDGERVVGVLSINDLSRRAGDTEPLRKDEVADVLASVGRPRTPASATR